MEEAKQTEREWRMAVSKGGAVVITFVGRLSAEEGLRSAAALSTALKEGARDIVFDVHRMTGYDTRARNAWQQTLFPNRKNIRSITMRGGNSLVKLGGTVLAMALGCAIINEG